jgi:hypothetical protein
MRHSRLPRHSRLLTRSACLAVTAALCACGPPSPSSSPTPTPDRSSCQYTSDSVIAESPVVEVKPPGSTAPQRISKDTTLPLACGTLLTVARSGSAQATFGAQGLCQLTQYEHQAASLVSRDPAGDLLTLQAGHLTCTVNGPVSLPPSAVQCPFGKVVAQRAQYFDICAPGRAFIVAVRLGAVSVIRPNGKTLEVESGQEWAFDFSTGSFDRVPPRFSAGDLRVFRLQSAEMRLS